MNHALFSRPRYTTAALTSLPLHHPECSADFPLSPSYIHSYKTVWPACSLGVPGQRGEEKNTSSVTRALVTPAESHSAPAFHQTTRRETSDWNLSCTPLSGPLGSLATTIKTVSNSPLAGKVLGHSPTDPSYINPWSSVICGIPTMTWLSHRSSDVVRMEMGLLLSVQGSLQALGAHTGAPSSFSSTSSALGYGWSPSALLCASYSSRLSKGQFNDERIKEMMTGQVSQGFFPNSLWDLQLV